MCTLAMAKATDERLRIKGLKGLRVADASVFPAPVAANTAATAMVVGERAAEIISRDWRDCDGHREEEPPFPRRKTEL